MLHTPMSLTSPHGLAHPNRQMSLSHAGSTGRDDLGFSLTPNQPSDLPNAFPSLGTNTAFNTFTFTQLPNPTANPGGSQQQQGFDPMFGTLPTNAFSTPNPWHGGDDSTATAAARPQGANGGNGVGGATPKDTSPHESAATTGPGEEKDPFLSLLEQLAENESFMAPGNELDFFLGGGGTG